MHPDNLDCDVLVVGGGHAGCEAAAASARVGAKTILLSTSLDTLGKMSCNPAIGGIAKGHLVREINAMGGVMPDVADKTAIQFRVLNRSKGYAVWSPRAQCDRKLYSVEMRKVMEAYTNLRLVTGSAVSVITEKGTCIGVTLSDGRTLLAKSVILSCGTFLNGLLHFGQRIIKGGRFMEPPSIGLTESLVVLGFTAGRLKTGTPPRLDGDTIDFEKIERQDGDEDPIYFSSSTVKPHLPQRPCWITHTNPDVHSVIRNGLSRAPLYTGQIQSTGPRYCPSIEDKIVRFSEKERHTIFLEPEGLDNNLYYPNGFATSLPEDIQRESMRRIPGLENVEISEFGYAIEYDYFQPHQLLRTLETKLVPNLYFAGQINGTSGYEEAAAQGLVAGCNAALKALDRDDTFTLERDEAYAGVMIDDLITLGTEEPYRMFTSRAEYRLKLRLDNAHARLSAMASRVGLVSHEDLKLIETFENTVSIIIDKLKKNRITIDEHSPDSIALYDYLKRPEAQLNEVLLSHKDIAEKLNIPVESGSDMIRRIESEIKYSGYVLRQSQRVSDLRKNRTRVIPLDFNYSAIRGLSSEGMEKLLKIRPTDLGQASNISGLTPADLTVLLIHLKRLNG